jgi:hypothetical protein
MKLSSITASEVTGTLRFDSKFHLSQHTPLLRQLKSERWETTTAGETFGSDAIWMPGRFARVWASSGEYGKPLLVPYDAFRYVPWSTSYLSRSQVAEYQSAEISRGTILIVRSGRNCGPVTMVDDYLSRFVMSDDMLRVTGKPLTDEAFYFYAFLSTPTGQEVVRRDRNGSVIDHIGPDQLAALRYPVVSLKLRGYVVDRFRTAFEKRERARMLLADTQERFLRLFNLDEGEASFTEEKLSRRFSVLRSSVKDRCDAEPMAPKYAAWRELVLANGGTNLHELAVVSKPPSRYKTNYVEDPRYGIPMLNGRQIAQYRAIGLRLMSLSAFRNPEAFRIEEGTTLLTADGRAEENLADCALVTKDRAGWGASGHVHRVVPRSGINRGLVYLACASYPVQQQLKALATGSVVDALSEGDVGSVVVPYSDSSVAQGLGESAEQAWNLFAEAGAMENAAMDALETEFAGVH